METFCGFMNMPPPMTKKTYHKCIDDIHPIYMKCAANSMKQAAYELREVVLRDEFTDEAVADVDISAEGSWQKRGLSSLNGFVTKISLLTGKCLDFAAMCKPWGK